MTQAPVEHAKAVAREAIRAGLMHPNQARELYEEYQRFVARNVKGSFTQLLLARGIINNAGYDLLETAVPEGSPEDSQLLIDTAALPAYKVREAQAAGALVLDPGTDGGRIDEDSADLELTMNYEDVLPTPQASSKKRTTERIAPPAPPGPPAGSDGELMTMAYEEVLEVPDAAPAEGPGWGSRVIQAPSLDDLPHGDRSGVVSLPGLGSDTHAQPSGVHAYPSGVVSLPGPPAPAQPSYRSGVIAAPPVGAEDGLQPIESTSADSRSLSTSGLSQSGVGSGTGLADSAPPSGLELVSDSDAQRSADFFAIDSVEESEGDEFEEAPDQPAHPQPGDVFGNYKLEHELGRGGMGVIYMATRIDAPAQKFALKTLFAGTGPSAVKRRKRFQREVEALRRLTHTNIVGVHDCGRKGPIDYYVMDYIQGRELKAAIKNDDITPRQKLDVFIQMCEAVAHAHERNVIHRDLKPANVLLDAENNAHVLDFGLAKLSDESLELTRTGAALGTPYYMAPEQIQNPKDVDFRVDIFALGVILFELMTGTRPFTGETAGEVTNKIMNDEPVRPSTLNAKLRPAMDALCLKAMEKDAAERYQSVEELRREVAKYRRGDRVRDGGGLAQAKAAARRYVTKHKTPLLVGFTVGFALAWLLRPLF